MAVWALPRAFSFDLNTEIGVSQHQGHLFGGPHNKDYSILGSILGFPYFGKVLDRGGGC